MKHTSPTRAHRHMRAVVFLIAMTLALLVTLLAKPAGAAPDGASDDAILVFAASSLAPPLQQIATLYHDRNAGNLRFAFASSAALARQIEYGAPADLFITAHPLWLERLAARQRIDMAAVRAIAGNRLVVARSAAGSWPGLQETKDIRVLLLAQGVGRIATGDPASVPLGMYARDSLRELGLWDAVSPRLAPAANARAALLQVERGLATLGILYASDVRGSRRAVVVAEMPRHGQAPIQYLAALVEQAPGRKPAGNFLALLTSPEAEEVFLQHGFSAPQ